MPRSIEVSESFANQDGMTLVLESTCEGMLTQGGDAIEMVGKASTVVCAMVGPTVLTILGVEDLTNVTSRIIDPLEALSEEEVAICCCALIPCGGGRKCCPCPGLKTC